MLRRLLASCLGMFVLATRVVGAQIHSELALPPNGNNQRAEVSQWIGLVKVTIAYHSPRVHFPENNDRTGHIWGELVKYGLFDDGFGPVTATPWRGGANETTTISFSHDVKIGGKEVKAGTYALFVQLANEGPWTWILNTHQGWGSFQYDSTRNVLRVPATPVEAPFTEFLTYGFDDRLPGSAVAFLQWEKKRLSLEIDVPNVNELYIAQIRQDLEAWPGFNYQNWQTAAQFAVANNFHLEEALAWANKAINEPFRGAAIGREDFSTLQTKASVLQAMGRNADADTLMDRAVRIGGTNPRLLYSYGMSLLNGGRAARALTVFKANRELHRDEQFWTSLGLARGYTAAGDTKSAIANWEIVLRNVPPAFARNIPSFERALQALRTKG
jgi:tetratricopeptide (TPR) repeat protein